MDRARMELSRVELLETRQERLEQRLKQERRIEHQKELHSGAKARVGQEPLQKGCSGARISDDDDRIFRFDAAENREEQAIERHTNRDEGSDEAEEDREDEGFGAEAVRSAKNAEDANQSLESGFHGGSIVLGDRVDTAPRPRLCNRRAPEDVEKFP